MQVFGTTIGWDVIIFLTVVMPFFLIILAIFSWASKPRPYSAREMKRVQEEIEEKAKRPKPPWADDPIAKSIEWTGTAAFGSDYDLNPKGIMARISSAGANRIEFKQLTASAWYAWMLFFGTVGFVIVLIESGSFARAILAPLICLTFNGIVWLAVRLTENSVVFDKQLGTYWRGKVSQAHTAAHDPSGVRGRISDIYALQLVCTRMYYGGSPRLGVESEHRETIVYELNLVLKDGTRISMVVLEDYDALDHDAKILAAFLQRPLWKPG